MSVPSVHEIKGSLAASAWSNTSCAARRRSRFLLSHRSPRVRDVAAFGVRSFLGYSIDPVCGQLMNSCQLSPTHFRVHETPHLLKPRKCPENSKSCLIIQSRYFQKAVEQASSLVHCAEMRASEDACSTITGLLG